MTPLVLVHGFMGGGTQWQLQQALAAKRRLICVDLPGFGRNAHLPTIDSIAGFADSVLAHLAAGGIDTFDLLGHSMGGMIVQEMVHRAPARVDRLILYGTGPLGLLPGRFEPIERSMDRARAEGAKATARRISATWFLNGEASAQYPACAGIAECAKLDAILAGLRAMQTWSGEAYLSEIAAETLVIWGEADRTYPWSQVEKLWHAIRNSHLAVLPHCAHAVHLEQPDLFNLIVQRFLEDTHG